MMEIWDLVDKEGRNIGVKWSRENNDSIPIGCYHPCVEIWVKTGELLLVTQRHPDKHEGLKYDLPGGAVISGESIIEGAVRELFEEVGIYAEPSRLIPLGSTINGRVYAVSYLLQLDTLPKITMQPSEVVGYKLVSRDEFEQMTDSLTRGTKRRYLVYKNQVFD